MARSYLYCCRFCRRACNGTYALTTHAGRWVLARSLRSAWAARTSLGWKCLSAVSGNPRCRPLDHKSTRCDRCPAIRLTNAVLHLGRNRHVVRIGHRLFSGVPPLVASGTTDMAVVSRDAGGTDCSRERGACDDDRGNNGDPFKVSSMRTGARHNRDSTG